MDVEIFPHRLLNIETTEKLLIDLEKIDAVNRIVLHGRRLPPEETGSGDTRFIMIRNERIDLHIKTGRVLIDIDENKVENLEQFREELRGSCTENLPFGFNITEGNFIRKQKTVSDALKYGEALEDLPDQLVGLTDQNVPLKERTSIIRK
jgi:methyl-coenzyme M reductase subunit D